MRRVTLDQARRIALGAQGFGETRPPGRVDVRHFRRVFRSIGILQLDSVNVLVRSHYLPVFSRLGPYDRAALHRWTTKSEEIFEYWGHMASLLPTDLYPELRFRMDQWEPWGRLQRIIEEQPGYVESVYEQIVAEGPLQVADLDEPGRRTGPWWGYPPGKTALEWLFASGRVSAYRTTSFGRLYDLVGRVLPADVIETPPLAAEAAYRALLLRSARHHGIGTAWDFGDYYRLHMPTARPVLAALAREGALEEVEVPGWRGPVYLYPSAIMPHRVRGAALLSPFDSLVWERDRTERLFDFRYRIEIYVPREKRIHGYYVLPFLLDGRLRARVDLKTDRALGTLRVRSAFIEPGEDPRRVAPALASELETMADWLGLPEIAYEEAGDLMPVLHSAT